MCGPTGLYHHEYYCTCPAVCQDCGAPAWDLCQCPRCVSCKVRVKREDEMCGECLSDEASYYVPDEGGSC